LRGTKTTGAGLRNLAGMPLREFSVPDNDSVTDETAAMIAKQFPDLTYLCLHGSGVTNKGLVHVATLSHLKRLSLNKVAGITDCANLVGADARTLEELYLDCDSVDDKGIRALPKLEHLKNLSMDRTNVSDDGIIYLKQCSSLKSLNVKHTQITQKGIAELFALKIQSFAH
jgi:hypothetical protein